MVLSPASAYSRLQSDRPFGNTKNKSAEDTAQGLECYYLKKHNGKVPSNITVRCLAFRIPEYIPTHHL